MTRERRRWPSSARRSWCRTARTAPSTRHALIELAGATLRGEGIEHGELSLSFVDDDEMTELHRRYMDEDGPTDVLSFPMDADDAPREGSGCWATS